MKQMQDQSVDMILTDPPYGINYKNQFTQHEHNPILGDEGIDYERFSSECYRILRNNSHAYFFTRFDKYPFHYRCLEQAGFQVKNCLVIEKGNVGGIGDLKGSFANNSEWIIFCQKGRRGFNSTRLMRNKKSNLKNYGRERKPINEYKTRFNACWFGSEYPKATYNSGWQRKHGIYHPTIKNVECMEWLIQLSSNAGETVFDPFMGIATTAIASIHTGRLFWGSEIEPNYFEIGVCRIIEEMEE